MACKRQSYLDHVPRKLYPCCSLDKAALKLIGALVQYSRPPATPLRLTDPPPPLQTKTLGFIQPIALLCNFDVDNFPEFSGHPLLHWLQNDPLGREQCTGTLELLQTEDLLHLCSEVVTFIIQQQHGSDISGLDETGRSAIGGATLTLHRSLEAVSSGGLVESCTCDRCHCHIVITHDPRTLPDPHHPPPMTQSGNERASARHARPFNESACSCL